MRALGRLCCSFGRGVVRPIGQRHLHLLMQPLFTEGATLFSSLSLFCSCALHSRPFVLLLCCSLCVCRSAVAARDAGCTVSLVEASKVEQVAEAIVFEYKEKTGVDATTLITRPGPGAQIVKLA